MHLKTVTKELTCIDIDDKFVARAVFSFANPFTTVAQLKRLVNICVKVIFYFALIHLLKIYLNLRKDFSLPRVLLFQFSVVAPLEAFSLEFADHLD